MGYDDDHVTIDRLPNPKWSKQKLEIRRSRGLFPWWVWPVAILAALGTFLIIWFGAVLPAKRSAEGAVATPTATPTTQAATATPTGLPAVPPAQPSATLPPPTAAVAPTATSVVVPTPAGPITVGSTVHITGTGGDKLRVRSGPGLNYTTIKLVPDGYEFKVLEGPQSANGYEWWRLEDAEGTIGWAVANYLQTVSP